MPWEYAEKYVTPVEAELGPFFTRRNEFNEPFRLRWGRIRFDLSWGAEADLKVILKVFRSGGTCEKFIVDTDPYDIQWNRHKRATRDFFIHPCPAGEGRVTEVRFALVAHVQSQSIPSRHEYLFMERITWEEDRHCRRAVAPQTAGNNDHCVHEVGRLGLAGRRRPLQPRFCRPASGAEIYQGTARPSLPSQALYPRPDRPGHPQAAGAARRRPEHQGLRRLHRRREFRQSPDLRRRQRSRRAVHRRLAEDDASPTAIATCG